LYARISSTANAAVGLLEQEHCMKAQNVNLNRTPSDTELAPVSNKQQVSGCIFMIILMTMLSPVLAQDGGTGQNARNAPSSVLEEVVVTAQRRAESVQEVPISITAVSQAMLEQLNIDDFSDFIKIVPSLNYLDFGPTGSRGVRPLAIRGVYSDAGNPTVGFYIDETPIPAFDPKLFDINRIEVLRGPQGTLYGASSMGGTIRILTNQPDAENFEGRVDATSSFTDEGGFNFGFNGMVNLPLIADKLALRVSAVSRFDDGYIDNFNNNSGDIGSSGVAVDQFLVDRNHNTEQINALSVALAIIPNDRLTITPSVLYQNTDVGARSAYLSSLDGLQSNYKLDTGTEEDNLLTALNINYSMATMDFVSSTSWYESNFDDPDDLTDLERSFVPGTPPIAQENIGQTQILTQEFRLVSTPDHPLSDRLDWAVGTYYSKKDNKFSALEATEGFGDATRDEILYFSDLFGLSPDEISLLFFGVPFDSINDLAFAYDATTQLEEIALFGEATGHLTDRLDLLVGLRWFNTDFSQTLSADGLFNGGPSGPTSASSSDSGINPKVSLSYRLNDDRMIYSTIAKGYRAGGANYPNGSACDGDLEDLGLSGTPEGYDSDSLWSYELGAKTTWLENRMLLNAAVYYNDWSDIQQNVLLPTCFQGFVANVGKAHSQGFEIELAAVPTESLELGFSVSYTDAEFDEDNASVGISKGDPVQIISDWKVNLNGQYTFPVSGDLMGYFAADFQYLSDAPLGFNFDQPEINTKDAYSLLGMQLGINRDSWELFLFVNNALNESPALAVRDFGAAVGSSDRQINTLRPRTVGLTLRTRFN